MLADIEHVWPQTSAEGKQTMKGLGGRAPAVPYTHAHMHTCMHTEEAETCYLLEELPRGWWLPFLLSMAHLKLFTVYQLSSQCRDALICAHHHQAWLQLCQFLISMRMIPEGQQAPGQDCAV